MDGVVSTVLASAGQPADYFPGAHHWWVIRTLVLVLFIPATLFAILLLYGGKVQNKNIGPLALRGLSSKTPILQAPRTIVSSELEAKKVRCTFYLQYLDRRGRPKLRRLARSKKFIFKLSALNKRYSLERSDMIGFWNMTNWSSLHTGMIENIPYEKADTSILLNEDLDEAAVRKLFPRPPQGEIVSIPENDLKEIAQSHRDEILYRLRAFGKFKQKWDAKRKKEEKRKKPPPESKFSDATEYKDLPDLAKDANIFVRMHFSANPLTHPDEQVKTTAWLTVLTSLFALLSTWLYQGF